MLPAFVTLVILALSSTQGGSFRNPGKSLIGQGVFSQLRVKF